MTTNQTGPLTGTFFAPFSLRVPKPEVVLSFWRKPITHLSLSILSVLCASVVCLASVEFTTGNQSALSIRTVEQPTIVILVRHAEKTIVPPENKDPDISPAGLTRAQELARMFGDSGIKAIYATQFKRTQQTVKPLADKLGLPVTQVPANKTSELVKLIREGNLGQIILIAGHNNSVPEIIAALGGPQLPIIPETEFDNLYILTVQSDGSAKLLKMRYGSALPVSGQSMAKP